MRWKTVLSVLLSVATLMIGPNVAAQSPSSKVVTLVVPFSPGGGHDSMARILAPRLAERLGQTVIVENRPGANGMVGADYVVHAKPDGGRAASGGGHRDFGRRSGSNLPEKNAGYEQEPGEKSD